MAKTQQETKAKPETKAPKLPFGPEMAVKARKLAKRVEKLAKKVGQLPTEVLQATVVPNVHDTVASDAVKIVQKLVSLADRLEKLPADAVPVKKARGERGSSKVAYVAGATVRLKDEYRALFSELTPEEQDGLVVVNAKSSELFLKTSGGSKMFLPKKYVEAVA
jgi:hypothetical protein